MYDVEMMQMLNLIHLENQQIFELIRLSVLSEEGRKRVSFDVYEKEYKRIMKNLEKYSLCTDCTYKNLLGRRKHETI